MGLRLFLRFGKFVLAFTLTDDRFNQLCFFQLVYKISSSSNRDIHNIYYIITTKYTIEAHVGKQFFAFSVVFLFAFKPSITASIKGFSEVINTFSPSTATFSGSINSFSIGIF